MKTAAPYRRAATSLFLLYGARRHARYDAAIFRDQTVLLRLFAHAPIRDTAI